VYTLEITILVNSLKLN